MDAWGTQEANMLLDNLGIATPDLQQAARITIKLLAAALCSGIIGMQRERAQKFAGLRTHVLVGLGTAFFVVSAQEAGLSDTDLSRVIQGLATGIGFIGAGAILKLDQEQDIKGLTTAASLWVAAAIGVAAGLGLIFQALLGAILAWMVLSLGHVLERHLNREPVSKREDDV